MNDRKTGGLMNSSELLLYRKNKYSQNGEDGIISEIMKRMNIHPGWFCEFGAWDGKYGSNTYSLLLKNWKGLMIEGDMRRFSALQRTARKFPDNLYIQNAYVSCEMIGEEKYLLDNLLAKTKIPKDFDLLSIDIDSYDYHVWRSLNNYRPRIVIIEIDSSTLPGEDYVYNGNPRLTSFSAMLRLGKEKGYTLICHTGNLFFVGTEYLDILKLDANIIENPNQLFIKDWVSPTKNQILKRKIINMTWQRAFVKFSNFISK
jgi:hypothetical protein